MVARAAAVLVVAVMLTACTAARVDISVRCVERSDVIACAAWNERTRELEVEILNDAECR
jgi:hypothetical protein